MSRSNAVRAEALKLDGNRCQITGYDGRSEEGLKQLEVHHVEKLGMGGSDERDVVENMITLHAPVHVMVETGQLVIAEWRRSGSILAGITLETDRPYYEPDDGTLEVIDNQNVLGHGVGRVSHDHLWFYRRHDAEEGEQILTQLSSFASLDSTIAERVYRLGQVVDVTDPASRTLRECLASNGLDTRRLIGAANLWQKSLESGVDWCEGMSVSDYRRMLKHLGHGSKREWFYSMAPHPSHRRKLKKRGWLTVKRQTVIRIRTSYESELRDMMEIGDELEKTGKFVYGPRAEGGKLFKPGGSVEVDVVHFVPKEA